VDADAFDATYAQAHLREDLVDRLGPASRAESEDHACDDSQQPSEDRRGEDDPDKRLVCRAEYPAHLDAACVGDRERDHDDEQKDESTGPGVEPGVVRMSPEAVAGKLRSRCLLLGPRCLLFRSGFRLHVPPSWRQVPNENGSRMATARPRCVQEYRHGTAETEPAQDACRSIQLNAGSQLGPYVKRLASNSPVQRNPRGAHGSLPLTGLSVNVLPLTDQSDVFPDAR
jgi:hypothetical protein